MSVGDNKGLQVARLNVEIKDEIYNRFVSASQTEGRTVSDVIRVLINQWLLDKDYESQLKQYQPLDVPDKFLSKISKLDDLSKPTGEKK